MFCIIKYTCYNSYEENNMKKKSKVKRIVCISLIILSILIVLPMIFVLVVTISSNTRSSRIDKKERIENNTGLVIQKGKALYDKDGNYLLFRGVNIGNLLVSEGWLSPFSVGEKLDSNGDVILDNDSLPTYPKLPMEETINGFNSNENLTDTQRETLIDIYRENWFSSSDFSFIKNELGMNMVRLPFYYRDILDYEDDVFTRKSESEAFSYLDYFLSECKKNDLYCVLDLHGAPGSQNGYEHSGDMSSASLWNDEKYIDATVDLWRYISYHYTNTRKDLSSVIAFYDIMNEPCTDFDDQNKGTVTSIAYPVFDKIYDGIRSENDNHVICIEGVWSFNCFEDPKKWGWENIIYQTHLYNWNHKSIPYWLFNDYHELLNWGHDYDVPYYIGEFTFFEDEKAWEEQLSMYEKRGYSYSMWTYKASVTGWWTTSWSIYTQKLNLVDGKTKINLKTATFDEIKTAFENTNTTNCELSNTYRYVKDFIESRK